MKHIKLSLLFLILIFSLCNQAELLSSSESHFTAQHKVSVKQGASEAFDIFVKNVGDYWPSDHTWSGDAKNLYIENKAGGCFCETLENNGSVMHLLVGHYSPGKELQFVGGLGPLQPMGLSGTLQILFTPSEAGTDVTLTYRVNGYNEGLKEFAVVVDGVLGLQIGAYEKFANKQNKPDNQKPVSKN